MTNRTDRPVFLAGIYYESGPRPELLFLQQWHPEEGWQEPYCLDSAPPHVIRLNPGESITQEFWGQLPMSAVCRNPITRLEGMFRFRLEYFDSESQVQTYVDDMFREAQEEVEPRIAVSETFEIQPPPTLQQ